MPLFVFFCQNLMQARPPLDYLSHFNIFLVMRNFADMLVNWNLRISMFVIARRNIFTNNLAKRLKKRKYFDYSKNGNFVGNTSTGFFFAATSVLTKTKVFLGRSLRAAFNLKKKKPKTCKTTWPPGCIRNRPSHYVIFWLIFIVSFFFFCNFFWSLIFQSILVLPGHFRD